MRWYALKFNRLTMCLLVLSVILTACTMNEQNEFIVHDESLKRTLTIETVVKGDRTDMSFFEKIRQYFEDQPDVEVAIQIGPLVHSSSFTPWLLEKKGTGNPPDLVELTPNQMRMAFYHGKLEALNIDPSVPRELLITSPEGDVIGIKTKINPLIVYYNQDDFLQLGLEPPSEEWDWAALDNAINALKTAGKNVYIMLSPHILEWVTNSRYGGRLVDPSGTIFTEYLNSEQTVEAVEWLQWVGTKKEDYKRRNTGFGNAKSNIPIPYDLIEGNMALAIDFAYYLSSDYSNFEQITRENDRIGIAMVPGGIGTANVAHTSGFAVPKYSENKDLAMELLRYLTKDADTYYEDILRYTLQADSSSALEVYDPVRKSVLLREMKRSVPTSLYMHERGIFHVLNYGIDWISNTLINSQSSVGTTLDQLAQEADAQFELFKYDLGAYEECIKSGRICM